MKKISNVFALCFLGCFFVLSSTANAQLPVHLGMKLGLNLNSLSGSDKTATATGLHVGPFANVQLGKIGVRAEVLASKKGAETEFQYTEVNASSAISNTFNLVTTSDLWYVDVPILLDYKALDLKVAKLHLHLGPQFSFLLSDKFSIKETVQLNANDPINTDNLKETFNYKSSDLGLVFGVGVNALMFDAGIRYNLGLSKVSDFDPVGTLKSADLKNRTFQVYVGFKFF